MIYPAVVKLSNFKTKKSISFYAGTASMLKCNYVKNFILQMVKVKIY